MLITTLPLRAAVLCSRRAPGLVDLLERDRRRGGAYQTVCAVSSDTALAEERRVEALGVPVVAHPIAAFYARCGGRPRHRNRVRSVEQLEHGGALTRTELP